MAYYFAPIADGLGDLLFTLPALEALIASGEPTYLVVRSPKQEGVADCISGLAGWLKEPDFLKLSLGPEDHYVNLRAHPLHIDNVIGSDKFIEKFGKLTIYDVYERIAGDYITKELNIVCDFRNYKPLPFEFRADVKDKILLVPGSAGEFKCWNKENWIHLHNRLKEKHTESVVLGQPNKSAACRELIDAGLPWLETASFREALDVVSSAGAMVSVDTGLMHLSVQQGKPTIAFFLARSYFMRSDANCFAITAPECIEACLKWVKAEPSNKPDLPVYEECEFYTCPATPEQRCMNGITVEDVMAKLSLF